MERTVDRAADAESELTLNTNDEPFPSRVNLVRRGAPSLSGSMTDWRLLLTLGLDRPRARVAAVFKRRPFQ
jgi:hypothetical protein